MKVRKHTPPIGTDFQGNNRKLDVRKIRVTRKIFKASGPLSIFFEKKKPKKMSLDMLMVSFCTKFEVYSFSLGQKVTDNSTN